MPKLSPCCKVEVIESGPMVYTCPACRNRYAAWSLIISESGPTPLAPDDAYAFCPYRAFVNHPACGEVVECEYRIAGKA